MQVPWTCCKTLLYEKKENNHKVWSSISLPRSQYMYWVDWPVSWACHVVLALITIRRHRDRWRASIRAVASADLLSDGSTPLARPEAAARSMAVIGIL